MSEELKWEIDFSLNPSVLHPGPLRRLFVIFERIALDTEFPAPGAFCVDSLLDGFFLFSPLPP